MNDIELYLGDCIEVMKKFPDKSFDAIVTDPPFGIGFIYNSKEKINSADDYWAWMKPIYEQCVRVLKDGGLFSMWQSTLYFKNFWNWFGDNIHIYISCKNFVQLRNTPINYGYDPVIMFYKDGGKPLIPKDKRRSLDFFISNTSKYIRDKTALEKLHPCPRPLDVVVAIIDNFTIENGKILDPFMGSGTTGVACVKTKRNFTGIEIDAKYYAIAEKRIAITQQQLGLEI